MSHLEKLHQLGHLHMDLKPDNIVLWSGNFNSMLSSEFVLIDFGISKRYLQQDNEHVKFRSGIPFTGNVIFASKNAFRGISKWSNHEANEKTKLYLTLSRVFARQFNDF